MEWNVSVQNLCDPPTLYALGYGVILSEGRIKSTICIRHLQVTVVFFFHELTTTCINNRER